MTPLSECHGHVVLDGHDWRSALDRHRNAPDIACIRSVLSACRDAGITYYRDGGDHFRVSEAARDMAAEYGIDFVTPCFAIHKNGCYGRMVGHGFDNLREYRSLIGELKKRRADFVKIMISGIISYDEYGVVFGGGPEMSEIREMIAIAHGEGFAVMAHANTPEVVLTAVDAGVDSIEHGFFLDDEAISAMAEKRTLWVPTLATATALIGAPGYDSGVIRRIVKNHGDNIKKAHTLGVPIATGSDVGAHLLPHGIGIVKELESLSEALGINAEIATCKANEALRRAFRRA